MQASFNSENDCLGRIILNRLQLGIAVLDAAGLVLFINTQAQALIGSTDFVARTAAGRLRFADGDLDRRFQRTLARIGSARGAAEYANEIFVIQRSRGVQIPVVIVVCGLAVELSAAPRVLVTFADAAEAISATSVGRLAEFFGLTPAEQRLTRFLAAGGRLSEAARKFGVSSHTVRNQLRAIFEKIGVQRQTDLTRLVMTGGAVNFPAAHRTRNDGREMSHAFH